MLLRHAIGQSQQKNTREEVLFIGLLSCGQTFKHDQYIMPAFAGKGQNRANFAPTLCLFQSSRRLLNYRPAKAGGLAHKCAPAESRNKGLIPLKDP
jgi:hypothetical protein